MFCPQDPIEQVEPWTPGTEMPKDGEEHSYILNWHLKEKGVKFTSKLPGATDSDVVLMGEKVTLENDYYMEIKLDPATGQVTQGSVSDFARIVELRRHGRLLGS